MQEYATSTVAMTIYNVLATVGGPVDQVSLFERSKQLALVNLQKDQFDGALSALVRLRMIKKTDLGFHSVDPTRRIIVGRNRNDIKEQANGRITGGWSGWLWKSPDGTITPVRRSKK